MRNQVMSLRLIRNVDQLHEDVFHFLESLDWND